MPVPETNIPTGTTALQRQINKYYKVSHKCTLILLLGFLPLTDKGVKSFTMSSTASDQVIILLSYGFLAEACLLLLVR